MKMPTSTSIMSNSSSGSSMYKHSYTIEATKSTKGASKLRRDLINSEIANLRDLLPLPASTRQRLSQLQLMALVSVYLRKSNYFGHGKYQKQEFIMLSTNNTNNHNESDPVLLLIVLMMVEIDICSVRV